MKTKKPPELWIAFIKALVFSAVAGYIFLICIFFYGALPGNFNRTEYIYGKGASANEIYLCEGRRHDVLCTKEEFYKKSFFLFLEPLFAVVSLPFIILTNPMLGLKIYLISFFVVCFFTLNIFIFDHYRYYSSNKSQSS